MSGKWVAAAVAFAAVASGTITMPIVPDAWLRPATVTAKAREPDTKSAGTCQKKDGASEGAAKPEPPLHKSDTAFPWATLAQLHTDERVVLDKTSPTNERFDALLADRVTGSTTHLDPRLLELLRKIAEKHPGARIELVSGFRSPKLNEMLRKKGHQVASHSQHSLGHAVDFRVVPAGDTKGIDPRVMEKEIRALGWDGGVGVYTGSGDWFVHADVGKNRRWRG